MKYVALLREINVGGRNIIKMSALKVCLEQQGFRNVASFIQSGNVIFESDERNAGKLTMQLEGTVLQHVPEPEVRAVIDELRRIVRPDGHLLVCEETDATLEAGDRREPHLGYTCGRLVTTYETWLAPWKLVATRRRSIEPDYPRSDVGTYMVFAGPASGQA